MKSEIQRQSGPFIMYIDDDADDLFIVDELMRRVNPALHLRMYNNGKEAYEYLESLHDGAILPSAVILDLNMPDWNGFEVLETIKANSAYERIPVFIFTNSEFHRHKDTCLSIGATEYVTKPYSHQALLQICSRFAAYLHHPVQLKTG